MRIGQISLALLFLLSNCISLAQDVTVRSSSIGNDGRIQIQVDSTTASYYRLFATPANHVSEEWLVSLTRGQAGSTVLSEQLSAFPSANYRVEQVLVSSALDSDGDGVDDITEINDAGNRGALNSSQPIAFNDGTVSVPDRSTFELLSYQGEDVLIDGHLANLEYVKFHLYGMDTDNPSMYFMNTVTHRAHRRFSEAIGVSNTGVGQMRGEIVYHPEIVAANGVQGVYRFEFEPNDNYSFELIELAFEVMAKNMLLLENNLAYYPMPSLALPLYELEKSLYDASRISILLDEHIASGVQTSAEDNSGGGDVPVDDTPNYTALNIAEGYGLLKLMDLDDRPNSRDIVIYEAIPNELQRVGGIITTIAQTPLSHVNLRAIQDQVPNAYIEDALENATILDLIDKYVYYRVSSDGYEMREATLAEVEAHYADLRPTEPQTPLRDLSITAITDLDDIGFNDWSSFGVKAANLATLRTLGFPDGTVPDGYGVPFYFYDEFMKFNGFYEQVELMLADPAFLADYALQETTLDTFRDAIKAASMPDWMTSALTDVHNAFPVDTSIRCRSSTNNEDLPGFSGAGLYDSKTQHPEEGHISKCIQQVFASTWNFRAFDERQFYRIDHFSTAMGVLLHPNFSDELANGVGVTTDPIYQTIDTYYLNTQVGEDLVTNPDAFSVPEELLLAAPGNDKADEVIRYSSLQNSGELIMSNTHLDQLRAHLQTIQNSFAELYGSTNDSSFAMEIEFKVTSDNVLAIKQARPWVINYSLDEDTGTTTEPLLASAGVNTVYVDSNGVPGEPVLLQGSSSGGFGEGVSASKSYAWYDAQSNDMLGQQSSLPLYVVDGVKEYLLVVTDAAGVISEDTVLITVEAPLSDRKYYGSNVDAAFGLATNNVDIFNVATETAYLCAGVYSDDVLQLDEQGGAIYYNLALQVISADPPFLLVSNAVPLASTDLVDEATGEVVDCNGRFEVTTGQYSNYIQIGNEVGMLTLGWENEALLLFKVLSYTPVNPVQN